MIDPTHTRVSDTLLLSDFMGNDSVYRKGLANVMECDSKLAEGENLGQHLDKLQDTFGPCMVSYGFISPEVSRSIITYQNPDVPSYHRWDKGAAADVCFPKMLREGNNKLSPIAVVRDIEEMDTPYSRLITYAESSWICFGTKLGEDPPRLALYENRYVGVRTPKYITHSKNPNTRIDRLRAAPGDLEHPWEGNGHPSYHGGGRRQLHHVYTSTYTTMASWLYDKHLVHEGYPNMPPMGSKKTLDPWLELAHAAGDVVDELTDLFNSRFSIIRAYNPKAKGQEWIGCYTMELIPSVGVDVQDAAHRATTMAGVDDVLISTVGSENSIMIRGTPCDIPY